MTLRFDPQTSRYLLEPHRSRPRSRLRSVLRVNSSYDAPNSQSSGACQNLWLQPDSETKQYSKGANTSLDELLLRALF